MKTFVALLRGINVGGHRKLPMSDLKKLLSKLDLSHIETYIQSGNAVFSGSEKLSETALANQITEAIFNQFGFDVPVIVFDANYLIKLINNNPYLKLADVDSNFLHITFFNKEPEYGVKHSLDTSTFLPDQFSLTSKAAYLYTPGGYGNTKLSNQLFEQKLKIQSTTRNWKTCIKLMEMVNSLDINLTKRT